MKARVTLEFEVEIEGDLRGSLDSVGGKLAQHIASLGSVVLSETFGEGDRWAILINAVVPYDWTPLPVLSQFDEADHANPEREEI